MIRRCKISFSILVILSLFVALPARAQSGAATTAIPAYSAPSSGSGVAPSGIQPQSPFSGSVPAKLVPGVLPISLQDAIDRGLKQNLGLLLPMKTSARRAESAGRN